MGRYTTAGDEMWFINHETAQRGEIRIVRSIIPIEDNKKIVGYRIAFTEPIPNNNSGE